MLAVGLLIKRQTPLSNGLRLDWSTKIKDIIPEWRLMDRDATENANLIDLLSESR